LKSPIPVRGIRVTLMTGMTQSFTIFKGYFPASAAPLWYLLVHFERIPSDRPPAPLTLVMLILRRVVDTGPVEDLLSDRANSQGPVHQHGVKVQPRLRVENPDWTAFGSDLDVNYFGFFTTHHLPPR
jgi:hypothetical protein